MTQPPDDAALVAQARAELRKAYWDAGYPFSDRTLALLLPDDGPVMRAMLAIAALPPIPSGFKITSSKPTGAMVRAAEREGYTAYSAREVWTAMHCEAPHVRSYGVERDHDSDACGCILARDGEPIGGPCDACRAALEPSDKGVGR